jgi:FKBP-type peptidyl-prolyl cis-trans isomerase FklB
MLVAEQLENMRIAVFAAVAVLLVAMAAAADMTKYYKRVGAKFLSEKGKEEGVHKLPSGMYFKVLKKGAGTKSPEANDDCEVHYEGRLKDGTVFDSSIARGSPATFKPTQVIKGWTEALQLMREGDNWEVYIPYDLAYGEGGSPPKIPGFAPLIFKMELLKVKGKGKTAEAAADQLKEKIGKTHEEL